MADYFLKKIGWRCFLPGLLVVLGSGSLSAQRKSEAQFRKELTPLLQNIQRAGYGAATGDDSLFNLLESDNEALDAYLTAACSKHPEMLQYDFKGLDSLGLYLETSADRKLRIYWWDQYTGGTMHFYSGLAQYETAPGQTAAYNADDGWYADLQHIRTASGKTVYLVYYGSKGSQVELGIGIRAIAIENGRLNWEYPFFHTKTKRYGNIGYAYSLLTTTGFGVEDPPAIRLSADKKTLTVPIVTREGGVTRGKLLYRFDGEKFVFVK